MQGSSVTFSSDANGIPEPTFSWTKDGSVVAANERISLSADNKELSITNLNRTDNGEYRCVAINGVNTVNSNAATLTVQGKHITYWPLHTCTNNLSIKSFFGCWKTSANNVSFGIKTIPCVPQKSPGRLSNMPNASAQNF